MLLLGVTLIWYCCWSLKTMSNLGFSSIVYIISPLPKTRKCFGFQVDEELSIQKPQSSIVLSLFILPKSWIILMH